MRESSTVSTHNFIMNESHNIAHLASRRIAGFAGTMMWNSFRFLAVSWPWTSRSAGDGERRPWSGARSSRASGPVFPGMQQSCGTLMDDVSSLEEEDEEEAERERLRWFIGLTINARREEAARCL